ncbi:MAG: leucine-rich repeat protein [Firmicutes bacterium]|nr:leucine-rich repeat protein [Bacillota bacterium]
MIKKGFTLIEVIVVVSIISILAAVSIPVFSNYISETKSVTDNHTLSVLNKVTSLYSAGITNNNDPFKDGTLNDNQLLQILVDNGFFTNTPEPQQKNLTFSWSYSDQTWSLTSTIVSIIHELTNTDITLGTGGYTGSIVGSYSGSQKAILIPKTINGINILAINQDVFNGKELTSVFFSSDSNITRIHARAFKSNSITEISLPANLARIDYGAFLNNNITKVTIGSNVYMESRVFQNSDSFRTAYYINGAGTYVYNGTSWTKQ